MPNLVNSRHIETSNERFWSEEFFGNMTNITHAKPQVRAVGCDYRASEDTVYEALKRSVSPSTLMGKAQQS